MSYDYDDAQDEESTQSHKGRVKLYSPPPIEPFNRSQDRRISNAEVLYHLKRHRGDVKLYFYNRDAYNPSHVAHSGLRVARDQVTRYIIDSDGKFNFYCFLRGKVMYVEVTSFAKVEYEKAVEKVVVSSEETASSEVVSHKATDDYRDNYPNWTEFPEDPDSMLTHEFRNAYFNRVLRDYPDDLESWFTKESNLSDMDMVQYTFYMYSETGKWPDGWSWTTKLRNRIENDPNWKPFSNYVVAGQEEEAKILGSRASVPKYINDPTDPTSSTSIHKASSNEGKGVYSSKGFYFASEEEQAKMSEEEFEAFNDAAEEHLATLSREERRNLSM